jgi:hypothetical protein
MLQLIFCTFALLDCHMSHGTYLTTGIIERETGGPVWFENTTGSVLLI